MWKPATVLTLTHADVKASVIELPSFMCLMRIVSSLHLWSIGVFISCVTYNLSWTRVFFSRESLYLTRASHFTSDESGSLFSVRPLASIRVLFFMSPFTLRIKPFLSLMMYKLVSLKIFCIGTFWLLQVFCTINHVLLYSLSFSTLTILPIRLVIWYANN